MATCGVALSECAGPGFTVVGVNQHRAWPRFVGKTGAPDMWAMRGREKRAMGGPRCFTGGQATR
jgi:hypothetical protein